MDYVKTQDFAFLPYCRKFSVSLEILVQSKNPSFSRQVFCER